MLRLNGMYRISRTLPTPKAQAGFSLVETLVALGIASVILLATLDSLKSQFKATSTISRNLDYNSLTNEIQMYLSKEDTCAKLFSNANMSALPSSASTFPYVLPTPINLPKLSYQSSDLLIIGTEKNNMTATAIAFDKVIDILPPKGSNKRYILNFNIKVKKSGDNYGSTNKENNFAVLTEVDPSNKIVACGATGNSMFAICTELGGTYDATASPSCNVVPRYQ